MHVVVNMDDVGTMLKKRGLEPNGRVQKLFTHECSRQMDPYVPMQQGILKSSQSIEEDSVTYNTPYARYQYFGKIMVGRAPKQLTDRNLTYHGAPRRGSFWDKKMWADKKSVILDKLAKSAGGKAVK